MENTVKSSGKSLKEKWKTQVLFLALPLGSWAPAGPSLPPGEKSQIIILTFTSQSCNEDPIKWQMSVHFLPYTEQHNILLDLIWH